MWRRSWRIQWQWRIKFFVMDNKINIFIGERYGILPGNDDSYGCGYGDGDSIYVYGCGLYGYGYGDGYGYGYGDGDGNGYLEDN